ncbi:hypothetical protein E2320_014414, partial [Naja naja]
ALSLFLISHHVQKSLEAMTEYPEGRQGSFKSSQELLREILYNDGSQDTMPESRKLSLEYFESLRLCAGAEGLAEPLFQTSGNETFNDVGELVGMLLSRHDTVSNGRQEFVATANSPTSKIRSGLS